MPANNDLVSLWYDSSGNGRRLSAPPQQGGARPTFKDNGTDNINGLPVVRVASGQGMDIPSVPDIWNPPSLVAGLSVYTLCKYTIAQVNQGPFWISFDASPDHEIRLYLDVDQDLLGVGDPPSPSVAWSSTLDAFTYKYGLAAAVSGPQVLAWVFDTVAGTGAIYRNGSVLSLTRNDGIYTQNISIGRTVQEFFNQDGTGSGSAVGDFVEIIAYGAVHSAADVTTISADYLMSRGGLA